MIVVYGVNDRIPVKLGELTFWFSPLSTAQRDRLLGFKAMSGGEELDRALESARLALKFSVKALDGAVRPDGSAYEVDLDDDGCITDDTVSALMLLDGCDKLIRLAQRWSTGIKSPDAIRAEFARNLEQMVTDGKLKPEELENALKFWPLDGVKVDFAAVVNVKKKPTTSPPAP